MSRFISDSEWKRQSQAVFFVIALFLFFVFSPGRSFPQAPERPSIISKISVEAKGEPGIKDIEGLIALKEGEPFSIKKIRSSIKQIYRTGLFSDIQVTRQGTERIELTFILTNKLFVRKIDFQGKGEISYEKLRSSMSALRIRDSFSQEKLNRAVEQLKEALNIEGYFYADIKTTVHKDLFNSQVDVLFDVQSAKRFKVDEITFIGDIIVSAEELKKKMETRVGMIYVPSVLENDITKVKEIYNSLDYRRADIHVKERTFDENEEVVSLVLEIIPYEKIEIEIRGAKVPVDLLKPIWEVRIFEEWGLAEGEAKIIEFLRKKNYLFSVVDSTIERTDNTMRIVYDVTPGERYNIRDISFRGLEYFKPAQIKRELGIGESLLLLQRVDGARLFELPQEIEFFYKSHGFPDTTVELSFEGRRRRINPIFTITEGKQEKIESIAFQGARLFGRERLFQEIDSIKEGPFFEPSIERDIEKLESFYADQGVRGTEILAAVQRIGEDLYSVNFQVKEGKKVKIENIVITGYDVTKKSTIQRELLIKEGDYAYAELLRETKRKLEGLGIFTEIKIEEIPLSPEKENLLINLKEGDRNYASLGLGLETKSDPQFPAVWKNVVRLRGTGEFIRNNIFGSAAQVSLVGQLSLKEKRAVVSWEQPYFFRIPMQTFVNAWLEREERKSYSFDRRGFSLSAIRALSIKSNLVFITTLRAAWTTLFDLQISESEVDRQHSPFSSTSISGSFIWDKRDDPFNAARGYFFSSVLEWAYPLLNTESDFFRTFMKYQHFVPVLQGVILSSTTRLGLGRGKIPIHERFFGGGSNSFRGVEFDELGPRDPGSLKPVGGKALLIFNFELAFPLFRSFPDLMGAVFYDKGNVFAERKDVSLASLQDAIGFGLRYRTPLGPVRLELGWNLDAPEGEKKPLAFITIGNVF